MADRVSLSIACAVIVLVSVPLILGKVPPNSLYGFRTQLTLSSPDIWYPANRFSGWALFVAAVLSLTSLWLLPDGFVARQEYALAVLLLPLTASVVASFLYLRRFS